MGASRLLSVIAASGMLGGLLPVLTACTSYTNVPGPDSALAEQDPNARQASRAAAAALQWVVRRHPVEGMYAINLPVGTSTETAERIAESLGPMAVIPELTEVDLPVYHIPRVWIRLSDAKVDVVYPMSNAMGEPIERGVTAWLNGGIRDWTVSRGQYWNPGTVPTPAIWVPIPEAELAAIQAAEEAAGREARRAAAVEENTTLDRSPVEAEPAEGSDEPPIDLPEPEPEPEPEPQPEPAPAPPPAAEPAPSGGVSPVYREVPPGA